MREFNVDRFLSDMLRQKSGVTSVPSIVTDITIQADEIYIVSSVTAFLRVVFDYLAAKHGCSNINYRDSYEIASYDSAAGTGSDVIVMNEHGFMDGSASGGAGTSSALASGGGSCVSDAIHAVDPATNVYLYIVDEVLV